MNGPLRTLPRPAEVAGELRRAFLQAGRLDRAALNLPVGLRVGAGVVIALIIGRAAGDIAAEASLGAGALLVGVTAAGATGRTSVRSLLIVSVSLAVSTFVGSTTSEIPWLHTLVLVPWCLAAGVLMGMGPPASSVGPQALAAMIVFGRFAEHPGPALHLAGFVLGGGAISTAVCALTQLPVTSPTQRRAVAGALDVLADLARAPSGQRHGLSAAQAIDGAETVVAQGVVYDAEQTLRLQSILDVARRARLEVLAVEGIDRRLQRQGQEQIVAGTDEVLARLADTLGRMAAALRAGRDPEVEVPDPPASSAPDDAVNAAVIEAVDRHLAALAGQVRAGGDLVRRTAAPGRHRRWVPSSGRRRRRAMGDFVDEVQALARPGSPVGRHALRLAVIVSIAELIARHGPVQRGYWIALTASVILRPEFTVTFGRGVARLLGTCVGVLTGGLVGTAIHGDPIVTIVAIGVFCAGAGSCFSVGYAVFTAFLTSLVVLLVGLVSPATLTLAGDRLLDTVIGGVLALVGFALWPTWGDRQATTVFTDLVERLRAYLGLVLATAARPDALDDGTLAQRARQVRLGVAAAEDAFARVEAEPAGRRFRSETGRGIVAGLLRVVLATHALRADLRGHLPARPTPEVQVLAGELDDALRQIASAMADADRPPMELPALRHEHQRFAAEVAGRDDTAGLVAETDEIVDAIDTVAGLLGPAGV